MSRIHTVAIVIGAIFLVFRSAVPAHAEPIGLAFSGGVQAHSNTCRAPSMKRVLVSGNGMNQPVGFYLGGKNTNCALSTLHPKTAAKWVNHQRSLHRSLVPLWVGPQAPCTKAYSSYIGATSRNRAREQGEDEADAAVYAASQLGLAKGSVLYYDMGNYNQAKSSCQGAVAAFLGGWDYEIHSFGYKAGVYTSPSAARAVRKSLRILIRELQPDAILAAK